MFAQDETGVLTARDLFEIFHSELRTLLAFHTHDDEAALRSLHRKYQELLQAAGTDGRTWEVLRVELFHEYLDCLPEGDE